jgi:aspartyl aminopeptidase
MITFDRERGVSGTSMYSRVGQRQNSSRQRVGEYSIAVIPTIHIHCGENVRHTLRLIKHAGIGKPMITVAT